MSSLTKWDLCLLWRKIAPTIRVFCRYFVYWINFSVTFFTLFADFFIVLCVPLDFFITVVLKGPYHGLIFNGDGELVCLPCHIVQSPREILFYRGIIDGRGVFAGVLGICYYGFSQSCPLSFQFFCENIFNNRVIIVQNTCYPRFEYPIRPVMVCVCFLGYIQVRFFG